MRKSVPVLLTLAAALGGCASSNTRPDELAVSRQRPLVIPPDYNLAPPAPGTAIVNQSVQSQALDAMFGGAAPRSAGETATLSAAGRSTSDANVRSTVADPGTTVVDKGAVTRDIIAAPQGDGRDARASTQPSPAATPTPQP